MLDAALDLDKPTLIVTSGCAAIIINNSHQTRNSECSQA